MLHKSCPNMNHRTAESHVYNNEKFIGQVTTNNNREFKLDHLLDINPKRIFKGSKFRCRSYDVIDETGKFWIEVIYSKEDERKFQEIFKLFRLCSAISQAPAKVHVNMFISALYKNDWHRAVVLELPNRKLQNKVRVRFVDMGIVKNLDMQTEIREIDQKFFNCPLKALHCSINLDRDVFDSSVFANGKNKGLRQFKFTKDARKFFTRVIFKRVIFAKIVNFIYEDNNEVSAYANESQNQICQVILGAQFHRGIIDIFMYLLSKYDRPYYEILKRCHGEQQRLVNEGVIQNMTYDDSSQISESNSNITTHVVPSVKSVVEQPKVLNSQILQLLREEYIQSYGGQEQNAIAENPKSVEDHECDFTEDDTIEETEQALFSNSINHQNFRQHETIMFTDDTTSDDTYYSVTDDDDEDDDEDEQEYLCDLERTPVKERNIDHIDMTKISQKSTRSYNNSEPLRINSIHLPPIKNEHVTETPSPIAPPKNLTEKSTVQLRIRQNKTLQPRSSSCFTPILLPPSMLFRTKRLVNSENNLSDLDTDTSLGAKCCSGLSSKFKWTSVSKLKQKIISKSNECPELSSFEQGNSVNSKNKKNVKFHIR